MKRFFLALVILLALPACNQPPVSPTPTPRTTSPTMSTDELQQILATPTAQTIKAKDNCDPSYPTVCIPPPPPDLDCKDISYKKFTVKGSDPHHFDSDGDGIGCEN